MRRLFLGVLGLAGAMATAWAAFVRWQGDGEIAFDSDHLVDVKIDGTVIRGEIGISSVGKQGAVLYLVEGRILEGPPGQVYVTRKGSRPPERGWWVSNVMKQGDSCEAEVEVELDEPPTGQVVIELDASEIARRPIVHRTIRIPIPVPTAAP